MAGTNCSPLSSATCRRTWCPAAWLRDFPDRGVTGVGFGDVVLRRPAEEDPAVILARQGGGFRRAIQLDTALSGQVGACDGDLTVGQVARALAALLDVPADELVPRLLARVWDLAVDGFLVRP